MTPGRSIYKNIFLSYFVLIKAFLYIQRYILISRDTETSIVHSYLSRKIFSNRSDYPTKLKYLFYPIRKSRNTFRKLF